MRGRCGTCLWLATVRSGSVRIRGVGHAGGNRVTSCSPVAGVAGPRGTLGMDTRPARIRVPRMRRAVRTVWQGQKKYQGNPGTFVWPGSLSGLFLCSGFLSVGWIPLWKPFGSPTADFPIGFGLSQSGFVFPNRVQVRCPYGGVPCPGCVLDVFWMCPDGVS